MKTADAAAKRRKKAATVVEVCSVRVGPILYGMPIRHILEIIGSARPQPIPLAPAYVGGLVHYRGDVLTTVSLRQLLGLPPTAAPELLYPEASIPSGVFLKKTPPFTEPSGAREFWNRSKEGTQDILVIESAGGNFGLLVDSVCEVLTVSSADFEPTPTTLVDQRKALLAGAYKLKAGLLVMLDPDRLDPMRLGGAQAA